MADNLPKTDIADPAKTGLGGRKPGEKKATDLMPSDVKDMDPEQTVGALKKAAEEGKKDGDSSLKIKIQLDLDVEVHLTARIKGDITIGLL